MRTMVYFLVNRRNGHIKIGISKNLENRIPQIRNECACGAGITIVGVIDGGRETEKYLHGVFADYRVGNSEWFAPLPPLVEFVKSVAKPYGGCTEYRDTYTFYGQEIPKRGYQVNGYDVPIYKNHFA